MNDCIKKYASEAFEQRKCILREKEMEADKYERISSLCKSVFKLFSIPIFEKCIWKVKLEYMCEFIGVFVEDDEGNVYSNNRMSFSKDLIDEIEKIKSITLSLKEFKEDLYNSLKDLPNYKVEKRDSTIVIIMQRPM